MREIIMSIFGFGNKEKPEHTNGLADFMRNGSARQHKRVFKKVIEESIQDQWATIEKADQIEAEECARANGRDASAPVRK